LPATSEHFARAYEIVIARVIILKKWAFSVKLELVESGAQTESPAASVWLFLKTELHD